jgi:CRP-like cAMP-binding protein
MALNLFGYDDPHAEVVNDEGRILADLTDAEWSDLLNRMERRSFAKGARVLKAGDSDRTLYLVASGQVEVVGENAKTRKRLALINTGSVFGEMAFFDGAPRSASVYALEEVEVLALHQDAFQLLATWNPRIALKLVMDLGRVLSLRLRQTNQRA